MSTDLWRLIGAIHECGSIQEAIARLQRQPSHPHIVGVCEYDFHRTRCAVCGECQCWLHDDHGGYQPRRTRRSP